MATPSPASIDPNPRIAHNLRPARGVGLDGFGELFGGAAGGFGTEGGEALADVGGLEDAVDVGVELAHDFLRRAGGSEDAVPGEHFEAGVAGFRECGDVGGAGDALR